MRLLHFSDLHGNRRAIEALTRVAARWNDAYVAITGDVCKDNFAASSDFDALTNPQVWLVPGNHDDPAPQRLGHLNRIRWQAPYLFELENCVVVGLDSEGKNGLDTQLRSVSNKVQFENKQVLIVLHHRPFDGLREVVLNWANEYFLDLASVLLLHGHEHHLKSIFAESTKERLGNVALVTSNVYSANTRFGLGCANLFSIGREAEITVQTVHDPEEIIVLENGFLRRLSYGGLPSGWSWGEYNLPTRRLEPGEDPLVAIDEYWRGLARDRS